MTALIILAALLIAILFYLIAAPFYIEVNSSKDLYQVRFHRIASARIYIVNESLFLELSIIGWKTTIDLLRTRPSRVTKKEQPTRKKSRTFSVRKIYAIARSFKLIKCVVSLDTGDMAMNGILYPGLLWMGAVMRKDIRINFYNRNVVELEIQNNFYRVLRAYISS